MISVDENISHSTVISTDKYNKINNFSSLNKYISNQEKYDQTCFSSASKNFVDKEHFYHTRQIRNTGEFFNNHKDSYILDHLIKQNYTANCNPKV